MILIIEKLSVGNFLVGKNRAKQLFENNLKLQTTRKHFSQFKITFLFHVQMSLHDDLEMYYHLNPYAATLYTIFSSHCHPDASFCFTKLKG